MLHLCALLFTKEFPTGSLINAHFLRNGRVYTVFTSWVQKTSTDKKYVSIRGHHTSQLLPAFEIDCRSLPPPSYQLALSEKCGLSSGIKLPGFKSTYSLSSTSQAGLEASASFAHPVLNSSPSHIQNSPSYSYLSILQHPTPGPHLGQANGSPWPSPVMASGISIFILYSPWHIVLKQYILVLDFMSLCSF